jgi:hypothetical protein
MSKAKTPNALSRSVITDGDNESIDNSRTAAFPNFNEQSVFTPGLTKGEYAMIQFVAGHLNAHGRYPDATQVLALADLVTSILDQPTDSVDSNIPEKILKTL